MLPYQMVALFGLATRYNRKGARILEIGTGHGSSAFMISRAASRAAIVTLTVNALEANRARSGLARAGCTNVNIIVERSVEYFKRGVEAWDAIFVDGNHKHIAADLPWFNRLQVGGFFLCHDYSQDSNPIVYTVLNGLADRLGRGFDVSVIDELRLGMAGFYRRDGETI